MTPTNRLPRLGSGLATNSDSSARVPRGHDQHYSDVGTVPISHLSVAWLREPELEVGLLRGGRLERLSDLLAIPKSYRQQLQDSCQEALTFGPPARPERWQVRQFGI